MKTSSTSEGLSENPHKSDATSNNSSSDGKSNGTCALADYETQAQNYVKWITDKYKLKEILLKRGNPPNSETVKDIDDEINGYTHSLQQLSESGKIGPFSSYGVAPPVDPKDNPFRKPKNSLCVDSTDGLVEKLWDLVGNKFHVFGSKFWYVDISNNKVQQIEGGHVKGIIKSRYEKEFKEIDDENKHRKNDRRVPLDEISISQALSVIFNRVLENRLDGVVDFPFYPRFLKVREADKGISLNRNTLRLMFLKDDGSPIVDDADAFLSTACYSKWKTLFRDGLDAFLDNIARHYVNLHHGFYKWDKPNLGWRDRVIIIVGEIGTGKTISITVYASLFGMKIAQDVLSWAGGATRFSSGINMPVLFYDDPPERNRQGLYGNQYLNKFIGPISNGVVKLDEKNVAEIDVPFHGLLFACANPNNQNAVLPQSSSADVTDKLLMFRIPDDEPKTSHDDAIQFLADAKKLPAFLIDRFYKMDDDKRNARYVDSHYIDAELMDDALDAQGVKDSLNYLRQLTSFLDRCAHSHIEEIPETAKRYAGWRRIRIDCIIDVLKDYESKGQETVKWTKSGDNPNVPSNDSIVSNELLESFPKKRNGKYQTQSYLFNTWKEIENADAGGIVVSKQRDNPGGEASKETPRTKFLIWNPE